MARISDSGTLTLTQEIGGRNAPSSVVAHPSGKFLYAVNVNNGIEVFTVDTQTGALTFLSGVATEDEPPSITVDPTGQFLYMPNWRSNTISGYRIADNGNLIPLPSSPFPTTGSPVEATFDPSGKFLYVVHNALPQGSIRSFSVDRGSGVLSPQGESIALEFSRPMQVISIRPQ